MKIIDVLTYIMAAILIVGVGALIGLGMEAACLKIWGFTETTSFGYIIFGWLFTGGLASLGWAYNLYKK